MEAVSDFLLLFPSGGMRGFRFRVSDHIAQMVKIEFEILDLRE